MMSHASRHDSCGPAMISGSSSERWLIIHADDAGLSSSVNRATIEALERGIVTSTSILIPAPGFDEIAAYARAHPQFDYGVHLALTAEWKSYRWEPIGPAAQLTSLMDETGCLWRTVADVIRHVDVIEAERELIAQIELALAAGIPLSHLDTHQGALFHRPDLAKLYRDLGLRYALPCLMPSSQLQGPEIEQTIARSSAFQTSGLEGPQLAGITHIHQAYENLSHADRKNDYLNFFRELRPGISQLIVHCGIDDACLRAITQRSALRESDYQLMLDPDLLNELNRQQIILTTWKDSPAAIAFRKVGGINQRSGLNRGCV